MRNSKIIGKEEFVKLNREVFNVEKLYSEYFWNDDKLKFLDNLYNKFGIVNLLYK